MRSAFGLLTVVGAGTGLIALVYGVADAALTALILASLGVATALSGAVATRHRGRLGSLRRQFAVIAGVAVGEMLVAVVAAASLMFVAVHDAIVICVLTLGAGVLALDAARRLSGAVVGDIETVRDALRDLGEDDVSTVATVATGADDEVAELAGAMNATARKLNDERAARDASDTARRDLLAAVSHDLRTPLTSLRLLVQAQHDFDSDEHERRRDLRQIAIHLAALTGLTEDLFELSRLQAGDISWSLEQVRIGELLGETVAAMHAQASRDAVAVRAEVPPDLPAARGNAEKLQRVLFNLIQNAIRHTPADGSVTVRARAGSDAVEIEVADTGAGITGADRERVFEPFFRGGEASARPQDGAGLGLAISRAIVEAHGGRMWIADSATGANVRFTIPHVRCAS